MMEPFSLHLSQPFLPPLQPAPTSPPPTIHSCTGTYRMAGSDGIETMLQKVDSTILQRTDEKRERERDRERERE
uniref:Uncharacterized protein n=1 Tax=Anopheles atroparvus TaxID=41427 RepID=A0AAG5CX58_ANOAO